MLALLMIAASPEAALADGSHERLRFVVSELIVQYEQPSPGLPDVAELMALEVTLKRGEKGWTAAAPDDAEAGEVLRLNAINEFDEQRFDTTAIGAIIRRIHQHINDAGIVAVLVRPDPRDIDPQTGADLRDGATALRIAIRTGRVTQTRTLASGDRFDDAARENHPSHARIAERSPIQPEADAAAATDLVDRSRLDAYVHRVNRHPGRRVDVALARADDGQGLLLDYLVHERRPWMAYYQFSNTGTRSTHRWRHQFGLRHFQLTDRDDVLALDYVAAGDFDSAHAAVGSYEFPMVRSNRLRGRIDGGWSRFVSSEVGIFDQQFSGRDWNAGGELIWNVYQREALFLDLLAGATWYDIRITDSSLFGSSRGHSQLLLPHVGVQLERHTARATTQGLLRVQGNASAIAGTQRDDLERLQRANADVDFLQLTGAFSHAVFLDPWIYGSAWSDVNTPRTASLAHELVMRVNGQYAFDNRLIPRMQAVVGGMNSVRGYPESASSGDTAVVGSIEYRLHVPRLFGIEPDPQATTLFGRPFRYRPSQPYGSADWNLMLLGFVDAGRTLDSPPRTDAERAETLLGAGAGVELTIRQNVSLRVQWARALSGVGGARPVRPGNDEVHMRFSFYY